MSMYAVMAAPWLRTGRAIATVRFLLAVVFLISLWIDPAQPTRRVDLADLAMASYLGFSLAMLATAWVSWRLDTLLAVPALLLDCAVFLTGLYFTETENSAFTSPYVAGFVFIAISALLRGGRRRAVLVITVLAMLYLLDCLLLLSLGIDIDMVRMSRRLVYMVLIALAFAWLAPGPGANPVPAFSPPTDARSPEVVLRAALDHAMAVMHARGGAILWGEVDGPPRKLIDRQDGTVTETVLGPEAAELFDAPPVSPGAVLWSPRTGFALWLSPAGLPVLGRCSYPGPLADCAQGGDAIVVPLLTFNIEARLVLRGIAGVCGDDLRLIDRLRGEIESALDRSQIMAMQEREITLRLRSALARDLHDGVAQSLAGALLRLEGLRAAILDERDPLGNLADAKASLRAEQANVREMIRHLKEDTQLRKHADSIDELGPWLDTAAAAWGVTVAFDAGGRPIRMKALVAFELRQLLREAIANAARHGACRHMRIAIDLVDRDGIVLAVEDDGHGLAGKRPRSIAERVAALGGRLETGTGALGGALLTLSIPKAVEP